MNNPNNLPAHNDSGIRIEEDLPTIWLEDIKKDMVTVENLLIRALDIVDGSLPHSLMAEGAVRYRVVPEISITISRKE